MNKILLLISFTFLTFNISCKNDSTSSNDELTVTDIDGNVYYTVTIGEQVWIAENLKVTHYRNGDAIPNVTDNNEFSNVTTGAYSSYDNGGVDIDIYGLLYNWYAVKENRNIAPEGWHIPTDTEWKQLEMYLGMNQIEVENTDWRGTDEGDKLKITGTTYWDAPNDGANNVFGFSALPGGYRHNGIGVFGDVGRAGYWWSSTEGNSTRAWHRRLDNAHSVIFRRSDEKQNGFSVRCVKN